MPPAPLAISSAESESILCRKTCDLPLRSDSKSTALLSGVHAPTELPRLSRVRRRGDSFEYNCATYISFQDLFLITDKRLPSAAHVVFHSQKLLSSVSCEGLPMTSPVVASTRTCQRLKFVRGESSFVRSSTGKTKRPSLHQARPTVGRDNLCCLGKSESAKSALAGPESAGCTRMVELWLPAGDCFSLL